MGNSQLRSLLKTASNVVVVVVVVVVVTVVVVFELRLVFRLLFELGVY